MALHRVFLTATTLIYHVLGSPITPIPDTSIPTFDVLIVGGGPAGLSAASALGRVRRSALLIDSGEYRNAQTQHMHDVIGNDGTVPSAFRALARQQISAYNNTVTMKNGTVTSIVPEGKTNASYFTTTDSEGQEYLSRKIILATGIKDILPDTPGLATAWGRGIYWCPWCDGYEHHTLPFANLGLFTPSLILSTTAMTTLNPSPLILTNGTLTPSSALLAFQTLPHWNDLLLDYNIGIENRTITRFERVNGNESDWDDDIRVVFTDGDFVVRNAILGHFGEEMRSVLPREMGLGLVQQEGRDVVGVDGGMEASVEGVFVVGDGNSDASENVPHAMWSAKRAVVNIHKVLAKEDATALTSSHEKRVIDTDLNQVMHVEDTFEDMKRGFEKRSVEDLGPEELVLWLER